MALGSTMVGCGNLATILSGRLRGSLATGVGGEIFEGGVVFAGGGVLMGVAALRMGLGRLFCEGDNF